jgi:HTH-type transcriptional regulator / antitoxin HigA
MTPTISAERYGNLLLQYQPRIIKTEAENEAFLAIVAELMHRSSLSPEEAELLDLLVKLIEDFEAKHYHLDVSTPRSRLLHLMDAQSLDVHDPAIGDHVALLVSGDAEISLEDATALAPVFHVKPSLFMT